MKMQRTLFAGLMLATLIGIRAQAAEVVGDDYNVTGSGSGFVLGSGVNSGINPPATRLTGSAAAELRYIKTAGAKADSVHSIAGNKFQIDRIANSSTISLSAGSGPFDYATVLSTLAASPELPAVYELTITMANAAAAAQRCSFAISSVTGTANAWDFGIQIYHPSGNSGYTLQKRMSAAATGGVLMNSPIDSNVGVYPEEVSFLIRVTDAGAETGPGYNSRVQVSIDGGAAWIYDTSTDPELIGWHFPGASRFIYWDVAGSAGPVTYDDFSLNFISGPTTADRIWTGAGADDNWSTGANWGGIAPATGDALVFNGTTRQANNNDISDLIVPSVAFNNGGFNLSGNPLTISGGVTNLAGENTFSGDLAFASTAVKTWGIATGSEVILNNASTVEVGGEHHIVGGGTLRLAGSYDIGQIGTVNPAFLIQEGKHLIDGGSFVSRGGYRIGSLATGAGGQTILTNGATFTLTAPGSNLRVGDSANPVASELRIDNSTLTLSGGALGIPYAANATGLVTQVGGTVSGAVVAFSDAGAGTGTYTIRNGTLEPIQIREDTPAGTSSIHFDNAILRSGAEASSDFFSGIDVAEIQSGGLILDVQTDVTIAQPLSGVGSLVKSNFATAILTGANTYSGDTVVQGGRLILPTTQTNATTVQVADGAELGVHAPAFGATLSVAGLQFNGGSFHTLSFDLGNFTTPTAPMIKAPVLSVSGPVVITVENGLLLTPGQFVLVDYDGAISGGFQFTLGSLPPGVTASLVNNTANSSIDLNITGVPGFRWTGAVNGDWDYSTQNWVDQQTGAASVFSDGFPTEFLDGAANASINLSFASPSLIVVSNDTLPYIWNHGAITTSILKKFGANSLTRVEGGADLIDEIELNAGSYVASSFFDGDFTTILTGGGAGTFVKQGTGALTVSGSHGAYDGAFVIQEGILRMGVAGALGSTNGGTTIAGGATLDLNDIIAPHEPVVVSGQGVDGQGAIIDSTSGGAVAHNLTDVTLTGDTVFGAPNGGRWDIRVRSATGPGPGLRGNGFDLAKVGPGFVSIACQRNLGASTPYWEMNLGDVVIMEGTLALAESLSLGNPAKTIVVNAGATLQFFDLHFTNPIVRQIMMTEARIIGGGGATGTNVVDGSIHLTGENSLHLAQSATIINGTMTGSGSLAISAADPGRVYLNGINSYPGDTVVTDGTLGGTGSLAGNLIMLDGAIAPGAAAGAIGTFTVNGDATLAGMTLMELNRGLSPNSDRLVVGGTLTFGGALTVALGADAPPPQAGDVYQLFNKGSGSVFGAVTLPDLSALPGGLAWDTDDLNVNGSIAVTGAATPPSINAVHVDGGNLIFSGTGGVQGGTYVVLSSTEVAEPLANWIPVATNVFGAGGSFSHTNNIVPGTPETFFLLQVP